MIRRRSEVEMFNDLLTVRREQFTGFDYYSNPIEKLLLHPLTQCYLHLKWSHNMKFYMWGYIFPHLIYSVFYSAYSLIIYRALCPPPYEGDPITCQFKTIANGKEWWHGQWVINRKYNRVTLQIKDQKFH